MANINPRQYDTVITQLREFFQSRNYIETPTQDRLSILAACEDPKTIATYTYNDTLFPLPQTGQMWLEYDLLNNPDEAGFYCITTSYRQEPNPEPGRHETIFPMFEFELRGDFNDLYNVEADLLEHLGFGPQGSYAFVSYEEACSHLEVDIIESEHEEELANQFGPVIFLHSFPGRTHPFWNMRFVGNYAEKIDVLLHGMETIGSAERSTNTKRMKEMFRTISGGEYQSLLTDKFGNERVENELNDFLALNFFERSGGGIGVTRLIRAMKLSGLL